MTANPLTIPAPERLYRTNDGRLVREGDPAAAFLFCAPGQTISMADVEKYGGFPVDAGGQGATPHPDEESEELGKKESRPGATKELRPGETKKKKPGA